MAEDKKSIVIYADWGSTFDGLEDDEAGRLIKHFFNYVRDLNPEPPDKLTKIAFEPIKNQLKRDLKKWESIIEKRKEAGAKGAKQRQANATFAKQSEANQAVTDTVTDTVTVTVTDTVINIEKELLSSEIWHNELAMHFKLKTPQVITHLKNFIQEQKAAGTFEKRMLGDLKRHFVNWGNKKGLMPTQEQKPKAKW